MKTYATIIETNQTPDVIRDAVKKAFALLGGEIIDTPEGLTIKQGSQGVTMGVLANVTAKIYLYEIKKDKYEIRCKVSWTGNALIYISIFFGFFGLPFLLIIPILACFVNTDNAYQQALERINFFLE